jgi:hypothetical protein
VAPFWVRCKKWLCTHEKLLPPAIDQFPDFQTVDRQTTRKPGAG